LIILIGFSRVYLRVHYASDVLAGFIIGIVWLVISLGVLERIEQGGKEQDRVVFLREKSKMTIYSDR
ncbi:MAG TPA: phosphatase PAP2 family protein, partial [Chitinophagaceae bacterium]|nr:phosphatase PAP2 family protein [Chitinophagaceae bacterium]